MRSRGLLLAAQGDQVASLASLEQALANHERHQLPFERARTLLALGAAQRRAKQWKLARQTLMLALGLFEQLGAPLWAQKSRAGLERLGGRPKGKGVLTATEQRVAELVSEGRSNKEVAAALSVAVHTVELHVSHVYAKLGLRSRVELARHFSTEQSAMEKAE
jgi:DNA-binding NarL/FixJ family response regulator